jgi:hypothetical protein
MTPRFTPAGSLMTCPSRNFDDSMGLLYPDEDADGARVRAFR